MNLVIKLTQEDAIHLNENDYSGDFEVCHKYIEKSILLLDNDMIPNIGTFVIGGFNDTNNNNNSIIIEKPRNNAISVTTPKIITEGSYQFTLTSDGGSIALGNPVEVLALIPEEKTLSIADFLDINSITYGKNGSSDAGRYTANLQDIGYTSYVSLVDVTISNGEVETFSLGNIPYDLSSPNSVLNNGLSTTEWREKLHKIVITVILIQGMKPLII